MTTTKMVACFGVVSALALSAAKVQAQGYGGYLPPPPYAASSADYTRGGEACGGFTLAGARAGVTVLGVDIDAGAGLRIGTSVGCRANREVRYAAPAPPYSPPPRYAPEPRYMPIQPAPAYDMGYAAPTPPAYGDAEPCGCRSAPTYRPPSRYGW